MVTYTHKDNIVAGVPLGGIGTGKIEIDNKVRVVNVTIANNWNNPIKELQGFHIYINTNDEEFFAQKIVSFYPSADEVIYEGKYPFVYITVKRKDVEVRIIAFSSIIPNNLKDSALPAVGLKIKVNKESLIGLSFPNITGTFNIGRINKRVKEGVFHTNLKATDYDPRKGNVTIISDNIESVVTQFSLGEEIRGWKEKLDYPHEVTGMADSPASIIFSRGESRFVIAWYFTGKSVYYPYGHYYENFFKDSYDVAKYFLDNFDYLERETKKWQDSILSHQFSDAIINSAYILSSTTWLDERGRFGILESVTCPCVSTLGTCYEFGSLPILLLFPCLEKQTILLFAKSQRDDGYIPHDLGLFSLDAPNDGTSSPPKWKDINPTFILLVYRYYKFTKDIETLKQVYPALIKALKWEFTTLKNGLPYLEGKFDSAFDATPIKGHDSYVSSVYIASLLAMREIARLMNDNETLKEVEEKLKEGREKFEKMFNGKYFIAWEGMNAIFTAQIFGEWWARMLDLEPIVDKEKIVSALSYIVKVNGNTSPYCVPNLVTENGKVIPLSPQTYSSWPRMTFAICWLAYKYGIKDSLSLCEKEWNNLVKQGLVWNQPSRISSINGKPDPFVDFLDHYIGSPAIWSFLF